jgi:aspartyl-tRNA(Asn)/glutamyl-tRNA(Gln) amidotransferase subunit B
MVGDGAEPKAAARWLINEVLGRLNREGLSIEESPVSAAANGALLHFVAEGKISGKIAKDLLDAIWRQNSTTAGAKISARADVAAYIDRHGLEQVSDAAEIEAIVARVLAANPDKVAAARTKPAMLGWFVGQVMQATGGRANPRAVNALLKDKLGV